MKICVVGGGIAGLVFSNNVRGFNVEIIEEHPPELEPAHCTGLISYNAYTLISRHYDLSTLGFYSRVEFYSSNWRRVVVEGRRKLAALIDRRRYEGSLRAKVEERGHTIAHGRVVSVSKDGRVLLRVGGIKRYNLVVLSEGAAQHLSRKCGLINGDSWWSNVVRGLQLDLRVRKGSLSGDTITVVLNHKYAPGYYGWAIPFNDGEMVRVGVGGEPGLNLIVRLKAMIKALEKKMEVTLRPESRPWGGIILTRGPSLLDHSGNIVRLGDSAYHVKPASGGGIYTSYLFASHLGSSLEKRGVKEALAEYYRRTWTIRRSLILQTPVARTFHRLDDRRRDLVLKRIAESGVDKRISENVDYDRHEQLLRLITSTPRSAIRIAREAVTPEVLTSTLKGFLDSLTR